MYLPKYLVIRFAPGAAGNMLSSLLQCSPEVAHWDQSQQETKPKNQWLDYFQQVFPTEIDKWMYHEPIGRLQWGTRNIFSAKYPRGNDLSVTEFLKLEQIHCNVYYHQQKSMRKYLPVFWHKPNLPSYFENSRAILIRLDSSSRRWFDHAVYHKHHKIVRAGKDGVSIQLLENRPDIVIKQFKHNAEFEKTWPTFRSFVQERIVDNPFRSQYQHPESMPEWPIPNLMVDLSELLCKQKILSVYRRACDFLKITPILSADELKLLHGYWIDLHSF